MNFFDKAGKMAIGSRLRRLTDTITADAAQIYKLYGIDFKPKWFPVFFTLIEGEKKAVTTIASEVGQTHPAVSKTIKEMMAAGLLSKCEGADARCNNVILSPKGKAVAPVIIRCCEDVGSAVEGICRESSNDLWRALDEWEYLLSEKSMLQRVKEQKRQCDNAQVEIVHYAPEYHHDFKRLNEQWITGHWSLEPHDIEVLADPQGSIIDKGGFILVALYKGNPVGVVAMCTMNDSIYDFELAKLAVDPSTRGMGIGRRICERALEIARDRGAKSAFLESNTLLRPAITLYRKLGFKELKEYVPAYARGDIQMSISL